MIKRRLVITMLIAALMTGAAGPPPVSAGQEADHKAGVCYKFFTRDDRLVTMTSRQPFIGDEIITPEGLRYRVDQVRGNTARVELLGKDNHYLDLVDYYAGLESIPTFAGRWNNRPVAIYHTHTDESYVPTDGDFSIPFKGGIYQVGETFHSSLEREQISVLYDKTPHCPHDANAYYRSRRTAVRLMKKNPLAMFDVHRDGVDDPEFYRRIVSTKNVTQMRLVVGRQNPKMETNLDFAKRLLAFGEKQHPGLLKEIYMARGNYNQDLLSTALLIEAGTYTNEKWQAQSGISLLADIVPGVLGLEAPAEGITGEEAGRQGWKTALFLILLLTVAFAVFIVINIPGVNARQYILKHYENLLLRFKKIKR